jgi:hypothetical protein
MRFRYIFLSILFVASPLIHSYADVQIKQFLPHQKILLGHPVFWTIETRSPLSETYDLRINSCKGADLRIVDPSWNIEKEQIVQTFRIRITATDLVIPDAPSAVIFDEKGQSLAVNGKALTVNAISGESMEIKEPGPLKPWTIVTKRSRILYGSILVLICLLIVSFLKRFHASRPRQILIRDLKKAAFEIQHQRLPVQVWRLLRSDLLWGFPAEVFTPSQLKEKAKWNLRLDVIADGLKALETWRYAGEGAVWDKSRVERSLRAAIEIAGGKT